ncbi:MAG: hypothetical protein LBR89_01650 [Holosporales bacterium]|jgi:hypothetical protein|nr:hypothetical protein [Holosporales bacterium]
MFSSSQNAVAPYTEDGMFIRWENNHPAMKMLTSQGQADDVATQQDESDDIVCLNDGYGVKTDQTSAYHQVFDAGNKYDVNKRPDLYDIDYVAQRPQCYYTYAMGSGGPPDPPYKNKYKRIKPWEDNYRLPDWVLHPPRPDYERIFKESQYVLNYWEFDEVKFDIKHIVNDILIPPPPVHIPPALPAFAPIVLPPLVPLVLPPLAALGLVAVHLAALPADVPSETIPPETPVPPAPAVMPPPLPAAPSYY